MPTLAQGWIDMNERIKELAEQAWDATAVSKDFGHPVSFAEKLAELIVRECAWIANGPAPSVYDHDSYKLARKWASEDVLNHFGVEE